MSRYKYKILKMLNKFWRRMPARSHNGLFLKPFFTRVNGRWSKLHYRASPGSSDYAILKQVFYGLEYSLKKNNRHAKVLQSYLESKSGSPLIIDAGANIGASASFFLSVYPSAKIFLIEPEPENCRLISINLSENANVRVFQGGVGSRSGTSYLKRGSHCGHRIAEQGNEPVQIINTHSILEEMDQQGTYPFIYKIDIEGSESDLFAGDISWMERFPCIVIELHDWMLPFSGNSSNFLRAIGTGEWDVIPRGENLFFFNRRLLLPFAKG